MKLEHYIIACSIIAVALLRVHSYFVERYSGVDYYKRQAQLSQYHLKQKDIELAKLQYENKKFQQKVATYIPQLQEEDSYWARNIASVVGSQSLELPKDEIQGPFLKAKKYFKNGNFQSSVESLEKIKDQSYSDPRGPEITYLLMESYHQLNQPKKAADEINELLQLYPESHLSGYALIRLGDYYQKEDQIKAAKDSYNLAIENFSFDSQVVEMARKKIGNL